MKTDFGPNRLKSGQKWPSQSSFHFCYKLVKKSLFGRFWSKIRQNQKNTLFLINFYFFEGQ